MGLVSLGKAQLYRKLRSEEELNEGNGDGVTSDENHNISKWRMEVTATSLPLGTRASVRSSVSLFAKCR